MLEKIFSPETYSMLGQWSFSFLKNLLVAILVYLIGSFIIKWLVKLATKMMEKSKVDHSLLTFVRSIIKVVCWLLLLIIIISILGIETSSFIALFASAGVAIGMALSGTLQNFAGGVMILLFKPFKVGDYIEAEGFAGTVKEIQIFNTIINTIDNQTVIIPNGGLSTGSLKNYTKEKYRRVDLDYRFAYGTDLDKVKAAINEIQTSNPLIIQNAIEDSPVVAAPWLGITEFSETGVVVNTRTWCKTEDYWTVYFYMNDTVYQQLKDRGFMFPHKAVDVNVIK